MTGPRALGSIFRDPADWPDATCPVEGCEFTRKHPLGGSQVCDDCRDRGLAIQTQEQTDRDATERQGRLDRLPQLLAKAGCPTRYRGFTRASWEAAYGPWRGPTTGRLDGWTGEDAESWLVLLLGLYGRRKTSLATALLGERIVAGKACLWLDAASWVSDLQGAINIKPDDKSGRRTVEEVYEAARDAEVLLLDDVGSILAARSGRREEQSWWKEQLALLLRHREMWVKPTIVTSNFEKVEELAEIDASLVSRCDVRLAVRMIGNDYRTKS